MEPQKGDWSRMAEMDNGTVANKEASTQLEPEHLEENGGPRVIDSRRYLRLLDEKPGEGIPTAEPPRFPTFVEELQSKVKASEDRVLEYVERYRQSREQMEKEVEAIRGRLERTLQERLNQWRAQFIRGLLDVLDNLRRALQAAESDRSDSPIAAGMRATLSLFEKSLETEGVAPINPVGEVFDPRFHEAIDTIPVDSERDGQVVEVVERGYRLGDLALIRPAKVRVGRSANQVEDQA